MVVDPIEEAQRLLAELAIMRDSIATSMDALVAEVKRLRTELNDLGEMAYANLDLSGNRSETLDLLLELYRRAKTAAGVQPTYPRAKPSTP